MGMLVNGCQSVRALCKDLDLDRTFIIYAADLKPLHSYNIIIKYADDTTLLAAEHSAVDIVKEFKS